MNTEIKTGATFQDKEGNEFIITSKYDEGIWVCRVFSKNGRSVGVSTFFECEADKYKRIK